MEPSIVKLIRPNMQLSTCCAKFHAGEISPGHMFLERAWLPGIEHKLTSHKPFVHHSCRRSPPLLDLTHLHGIASKTVATYMQVRHPAFARCSSSVLSKTRSTPRSLYGLLRRHASLRASRRPWAHVAVYPSILFLPIPTSAHDLVSRSRIHSCVALHRENTLINN